MLPLTVSHMNERFDFIVFEEFQLVPYTNEAILEPRQTNVRDLYLPSVEMKTQSHSSTGLLTHCGRVTQICVFALQLYRTGDAGLCI